jgi:hypothetical protein
MEGASVVVVHGDYRVLGAIEEALADVAYGGAEVGRQAAEITGAEDNDARPTATVAAVGAFEVEGCLVVVRATVEELGLIFVEGESQPQDNA